MNRAYLEEAVARLGMASGLVDVQEAVRASARRLAGAQGATLVLRDGDQCFYADEDAMSPLWKGQRFPLGQCISGWAMLHAETVLVPDITVDPRIPMEAYRPTFVKSLAMVPIGREGPIGAIGTYWATLRTPAPAVVRALEELADATYHALIRVGLPAGVTVPS